MFEHSRSLLKVPVNEDGNCVLQSTTLDSAIGAIQLILRFRLNPSPVKDEIVVFNYAPPTG